ncbi:MAG: hypothetical protein R2688_00990 [Fimbriimonadaceae bacterium]
MLSTFEQTLIGNFLKSCPEQWKERIGEFIQVAKVKRIKASGEIHFDLGLLQLRNRNKYSLENSHGELSIIGVSKYVGEKYQVCFSFETLNGQLKIIRPSIHPGLGWGNLKHAETRIFPFHEELAPLPDLDPNVYESHGQVRANELVAEKMMYEGVLPDEYWTLIGGAEKVTHIASRVPVFCVRDMPWDYDGEHYEMHFNAEDHRIFVRESTGQCWVRNSNEPGEDFGPYDFLRALKIVQDLAITDLRQ